MQSKEGMTEKFKEYLGEVLRRPDVFEEDVFEEIWKDVKDAITILFSEPEDFEHTVEKMMKDLSEMLELSKKHSLSTSRFGGG